MLARGHRWFANLAVVVALIATIGVARAEDRIDELTRTAATSTNEKTRLAAVAALGKLDDRRAMKPLVNALGDPNAQIRAVAASALGKLGHKAALPALKAIAIDDTDAEVRKRSKEAASAIAQINGLPDPWPAAPGAKAGKKPARAGFGNKPRALDPQADLFVLINSTNDDSPGRTDKKTRQAHAAIVKQTLSSSFKANPTVTTVAADAKRLGLDPRHLDVSVTKLDVAQNGTFIEVEAQLRLAISDETGKMLSFLSGGAKVQVPRTTFNAKYLPQMRREALENAMRGMFDKLLAHLRDPSQT
jgi:hypothetical protein